MNKKKISLKKNNVKLSLVLCFLVFVVIIVSFVVSDKMYFNSPTKVISKIYQSTLSTSHTIKDNSIVDQSISFIKLVGEKGTLNIETEIVKTTRERNRGLMYRKKLASNKGMLFKFMLGKDVNMWMKNTYIPLDMIFMDKIGTILKIAKNTVPGSLTAISGPKGTVMVLEINGGLSDKIGLNITSKVEIDLIRE